MARIYQRGKLWYLDFEYQGKRYRKSLETRSKKVAELALKDTDVKISLQKLNLAPIQKIRFDKFANKFLEWYEMQNSPRSYEDYRNLFNSKIIPYFSQFMLTDITVFMIENYKKTRIKLISSSTVNKELIALRHLFNKAILWRYLDINPANEVNKLRVKQRKFRFLTIDEIHKILEVCPEKHLPILLTAIHAGLRKSELFRLEWEDIDFGRHCLMVSNKEDAHTKNYRMREIPITFQLESALKRLKSKGMDKQGFVFLKADGSRHMGEIRVTLTKIIRKSDV